MSKLSLFSVAADSRIDAEAGVLRGVSLISKGPAKGHTFLGEPIIVDDTTLSEVAVAAQAFADGVPVNFDHGTGIEDLVGAIRDVYLDGEKVRGDLYLLKTHESFATILEMAETMPSNFGISISFMNAPDPVKGADMEPDDDEDDQDGTLAQVVADDIVAYAARVCELYGADLVKNPACGNGLFQAMDENAQPTEIPAEAPVEAAVVVEAAPAAEATAVEAVVEEGKEELNSVIESEPVLEEPEVKAEPTAEESAVESAAAPVVVPAELARLRVIDTEFEANRIELAAVKTELKALRENLAIKEAQLVELNMLHRSVKTVLGLMPACEIPQISESAAQPSLVEQYEAMEAGPARLEFFQTHRRDLEKAIAARSRK